MRRWASLLAVATLALVLPGAALGVATLISPAPGEVVRTSHPVFRWSVPANEESDYIYVATSPQTTPDGEFYSENVEDMDVFFGNETSWAPTYPLAAGSYWWLVGTHSPDTWDSYYTAPSAFSIPADVAISGVRVKRYRWLRLIDVDVTWRSNTDGATVTARLSRNGRAVWSKREVVDYNTIDESMTTNLYWYVRSKKLRRGTPLRLEVTVSAGGATATASRSTRVP